MGVALFHNLAGAACGDAIPLWAAVLAGAVVVTAVGLAFWCGCLVGGRGVWLAVHPQSQNPVFPPKGLGGLRLGGHHLE